MFSCHRMAALWHYCKEQIRSTFRLQNGKTVTAQLAAKLKQYNYTNIADLCPWLHPIHLCLEVISPRLERVSPLPLPVALLPPLWPGETTLSGPVGLIILIAVGVRLRRGENSVWENFFQLGGEEHLQAAACLGHLRVGLLSKSETKSYYTQISASEVLTDDDYTCNLN